MHKKDSKDPVVDADEEDHNAKKVPHTKNRVRNSLLSIEEEKRDPSDSIIGLGETDNKLTQSYYDARFQKSKKSQHKLSKAKRKLLDN